MTYRRILFLVPLLVLLSGLQSYYVQGDTGTRYDQQVIAILQDDPAIIKAAQFLYQKHETVSHVVKWNPDTENFDRVMWNTETKLFETIDEPLPSFDWKKSRVQVVGHGDYSDPEQVTFGGASPEEIIKRISTGPGISMGENIGRISIVGCTRRAIAGEILDTMPTNHPGYILTKRFMEALDSEGLHETEVSVRSALVSVDEHGRKLTGELSIDTLRGPRHTQEVGIQWRHKKRLNKYIGSFKNGDMIEIETEKVPNNENGLGTISRFEGIVPPRAEVYVEDSASEQTFEISDNNAFSWVDKIAEDTYNSIADGSRAPEVSHAVRFFDGERKSVEKQPMREIRGIGDLLSEIKYFGTKGQALVSGKESYYRFGDFVLSMNLKSFYCRVEGVIDHKNGNAEEVVNTFRENNAWPLARDYFHMQSETGDNFFGDVKNWINGDHSNIGVGVENAYNAQCGMAMFFSESIRSFHTHITNMMSLDLVNHGYLPKEYFFTTHPMARQNTWQLKYQEAGTRGKQKKTGLDLLRDDRLNAEETPTEAIEAKAAKIRMSRISKTWLSHVGTEGSQIMGSRNPPTEQAAVPFDLAVHNSVLKSLAEIGTDPPKLIPGDRGYDAEKRSSTRVYLRDYEKIVGSDRLLASRISEPETESVKTQLEEFLMTEDIVSPLEASLALANDHIYVTNRIANAIEQNEQMTGKKYEVLPNTINIEEDGNSVSFYVQEEGYPLSEPIQISTSIDKTKLATMEMVENLQLESETLKEPSSSPEGKVAQINRGLAIHGVVSGLAGSIGALENGDIRQGVIGAAQSLHGLGELTGHNQKLYRAAGKYLGRALRRGVESASQSASVIAGEEAGSLLRAGGTELLATAGRAGELFEAVPFVGTAFGIYNIYEDFQQHSAIGYIDGGLDIAITGLSFLGPEAEPVVLALTIIRMGIDTFYNDIGTELRNLPSDASVGQKIGAVFKGIGKSFEDLFEQFNIFGQIFGAISKSHELDREYERNQEFLRKITDYHNYFSIMNEGSGASEINFAGGSESWNGGDITFQLGEYGQSTLTLEAVTRGGRPIIETHTIETNNVEDIVMGIGESHSISFKKQTVNILWGIPVHSRTLISGTHEERDTLHGTYYGNSKNNNFMAVQSLPPNSGLTYNLHDYHYRLFGRGGNDIFYLGPQHSYVEGNDGSDTYFISNSAVYTRINNYADDGETDYMIINLNFDQLTPQKSGLDLLLTFSNTHTIYIFNWFIGDSYQHMIFKTSDGALSKASGTATGQVKLMTFALTGAGASNSLVLDARNRKNSQVMTITGSDHNDIIFGNEMDNQIEGGLGDDSIMGGNGKDTYTVGFNEGVDIIDNYATDGKTDILIFMAKLHEINSFFEGGTNHLHLANTRSVKNAGCVLRNWFLNEKYRHLLLVTEDGFIANISSTKTNPSNLLQPILADMSSIEQNPNAPLYSRVLDLSKDPLLSETVTIFGSQENDLMIGNHKGNYMTGGKGFDRMEGKGGADVYVVKQGDGRKFIVNYDLDSSMDTLLLDANFDDIQLSLTDNNNDLVVAAYISNLDKCVHVTLDNWFLSEKYQHLVVHTSDGVVFDLPTNYPLKKTAQVLDNSQKTMDRFINLNDEKWSQVQRLIGSQGFDGINGNSFNNYMDPRLGASYLQGNNGMDTYVIKPEYGTQNNIFNEAEDEAPDTLLFSVPFFSINVTTVGSDIQLTSNTKHGLVDAILNNYVTNEKARHLNIISDDGIQFVLPPNRNFQLTPFIVNKAQANTGQHINLTAVPSYTDVLTVYGASTHSNCIIGNDLGNTIVGGSESDLLEGLGGDDTLKGGSGVNTLKGGPGNDRLVGGAGNDFIYGGEDDDVISPGLGVNTIDGGPGSDTVIYGGDVASGEGIDLNLASQMCIHQREIEDRLLNIENAFGTEYDDVLQGDDEDNVLFGRGGNDYLSPGAGYDVLNGGSGKDTYNLAAANGTVTIENYATDGVVDKVIMTYSKKKDFRYERSGDDLVVHVINIRYPVFFDGDKPTVIFKGWFVSKLYTHAYIESSNGIINLDALKKTTAENFYTIDELKNNCGKRAINSGDAIALQTDNRRFYMGCLDGSCKNSDCPSYIFEKSEKEKCAGDWFEIYRIEGPGAVKVGDMVALHNPDRPGTWVGCQNQENCARASCPGQPNLESGFDPPSGRKCLEEIFQIYSMSDARPVGEPIRANDKIGLYYVHGEKWLSFRGEGGKTRARQCPAGRPPHRSAYERCWGESFTLIDLQ